MKKAVAAVLLLAAACGSRAHTVETPPVPAEAPVALATLAPFGTQAVVLITGGAVDKLHRLLGPEAQLASEALATALDLPFDPLTAEGWTKAGLDPARGGGVFLNGHGLAGVAIAVTDEVRFRTAFAGLIDTMGCAPQGGWMLCAVTADGAGLPWVAPEAAPHGDVELVVRGEALARILPRAQLLAAALRIDETGGSIEAVVTDPRADVRRFAARPVTLLARSGGSAGLLRIGDIHAWLPPLPDVELFDEQEILDALDGEALFATRGSGLVGGTMFLKLRDAGVVDDAVSKVCKGLLIAATFAPQKIPLANVSSEAGGCSGTLVAARLGIPGIFDGLRVLLSVDERAGLLAIAVEDDPALHQGDLLVEAGSPEIREMMSAPATLAVWSRGLALPALARRMAAGMAGEEAGKLVEILGRVAAQLYEVGVGLSVDAQGFRVHARLTTHSQATAGHQARLVAAGSPVIGPLSVAAALVAGALR
jgi:hypothetical protein